MPISMTRRVFLGSVALSPMFAAASASAADVADTIYSGGPIITLDDKNPRVEAVAVKGGVILAAGSNAEVMPLKGANTRMVDLEGRTMLPGFVDSHGHISLGGLQAIAANLLAAPDGQVNDIAALQRVMKEWAGVNESIIRKANIILGFGYDNVQLAEKRHPTRDELDEISRDVPVMAVHQSGHFGSVNSKGLELIGFTAETADMPGGVIRRRDGSQEPNGVLEELAFTIAVFKLLGGIGKDGLKVLLEKGAEMWARFGYTSAQEARATPVIVEAIKEVGAAGGFKNDVGIYIDVLTDRDYILANVSNTYVNRARVMGAKLAVDGSPQGFTALRDKPYYDPVGNYPPGYKGYTVNKPEVIDQMVDWAYEKNIQVVTHCNGEGASDIFIGALKAASKKYPKGDRRPTLIHGQLMREDQVDSFKELGAMMSLYPMHTFYWGDWHRDHTAGPIDAENISPTGWAYKRGMMFTSHHDAPVAFPDSIRVLDATVTRRTRSGDILGPHQRVDVITGLKALTIWAAYQQYEETTKGTIEVGKLADLVILTDDPTAVPADDIEKIKVVETIKEGQTIFALTPEEQKKGELMLPGGKADTPFQRFVNVASMHRDLMRAKNPLIKDNAALLKAASAVPHDIGCIHKFMEEILESMTATA